MLRSPDESGATPTPSTTTEVGGYPWGGGGPLTAKNPKPRRKPKPLPYWSGINLQIVGPSMPTMRVSVEARPRERGAAPMIAGVESLLTPVMAPVIESTPLPSWARPVTKIRPSGIAIRMDSPPLPGFKVQVQHHDDDADTLLVTFLTWLASQ